MLKRLRGLAGLTAEVRLCPRAPTLSRAAESRLAGVAALPALSRLSSRVTVSEAAAAESAGATGGLLRGIRIDRGAQSLGSTSHFCSRSAVCWMVAPAGALPHPMATTLRNAVNVVERNVPRAGKQRSMSLISAGDTVESDDHHDLQARGQARTCYNAGDASRPSSRSCQRERSPRALIAPTSASIMSHCVSQGSPWVPRKSVAADPVARAVQNSISS
jgi:hypothetical protein